MLEAWKKYFNISVNLSIEFKPYSHFAYLEILVNENESDKIYKKSQNLFECKNEFYSYCLDNHRDLLNKFVQTLKKSEHIAINEFGIYSRCGKHWENLNRKCEIQKGNWLEKSFSSFQQKNLENDDQVVGLSLALMKLFENDFDVLSYFDKGTFLMWFSKKEEPVVVQEIPNVEPVKLNEW